MGTLISSHYLFDAFFKLLWSISVNASIASVFVEPPFCLLSYSSFSSCAASLCFNIKNFLSLTGILRSSSKGIFICLKHPKSSPLRILSYSGDIEENSIVPFKKGLERATSKALRSLNLNLKV